MGGFRTGGTLQKDPDFRDKGTNDSGELFFPISRITRQLTSSSPARMGGNKAPQTSSFLGKAGIKGLEILDMLGSSMTNLNADSRFVTNMASRRIKVSLFAFEVANVIDKGSNLMQSLSEKNIRLLIQEILCSKGVQQLVSTDMTELLSIAAADKKEEFDDFSREVIRFGDLCEDPQWHNLRGLFSRSNLDPAINKQLREKPEIRMRDLTKLSQHTFELYHAFHALDRFEQDYLWKLEEVESLHLPRKGESLMILLSELKHQRKLVKSLKKKSLWSRSLDEVVEKLVDIVTFIHHAILDAFGDNVVGAAFIVKDANKKRERLGVAGLALHYANLISQVNNVASSPTSLSPNMRDTLYNGLPPSVKMALRSRLQKLNSKEVLTVSQIKAEMEKTLLWLAPVATDTIKAHQCFGWVGEWANTGKEFGKKTNTNISLIRLQTLYHADKQKMDQYILELVTWLHRLIRLVRYGDNIPKNDINLKKVRISSEDANLLNEVQRPVIGSYPRRELEHENNTNILDVLDGLDSAF